MRIDVYQSKCTTCAKTFYESDDEDVLSCPYCKTRISDSMEREISHTYVVLLNASNGELALQRV